MKIDLEGFEGLIKKTVLGDQGGKVVGLAGREEAHGRRIWIVIFFGLWTWIPSIRPAEQPARVPIFFSIKLGTEKKPPVETQEKHPTRCLLEKRHPGRPQDSGVEMGWHLLAAAPT